MQLAHAQAWAACIGNVHLLLTWIPFLCTAVFPVHISLAASSDLLSVLQLCLCMLCHKLVDIFTPQHVSRVCQTLLHQFALFVYCAHSSVLALLQTAQHQDCTHWRACVCRSCSSQTVPHLSTLRNCCPSINCHEFLQASIILTP